MLKFILATTLALCCAFSSFLSAQTISITYKNPDQLVVCSSDTLSITVTNNSPSPVSDAFLDLELPPGLGYLPGSVSGAAESDISIPEKPVLALPVLAPNTAYTVQVQLSATCGLVEAINSAQLFSALLRVRAGALTEQLSTTKFQIQTSLLVITQVDNDSVSGEKDQILYRTLHVRNTRLGAVQHLFLRDAHPAGISIHVDAATTEQDQPTEYNGYFDGSFFTAFGDGDTLLEFGETVLIKQQITITDCGFPSITCRSNITASWSCTANSPPCQGDSIHADVVILPSTYQPKLTFQTHYALPWDHCAQLPHEMRMRIVNEGPAPATNLILQINSEAPTALSMDKNSFRLHYQNGTTDSLTPNLTEDFLMPECGDTNSAFVTLYIPDVPGYDTVDLSFDAFYCLPSCKQSLPKIRLNYYYNKPCPPGGFIVSDTVTFEANLRDYLSAAVTYGIGDCLEDGQEYDFQYRLQSNRLLTDTGYLWLKFDLPLGLEWSPNCPPKLDGKAPVAFSIDSAYTDYPIDRVLAAFELPLSDTFFVFNFCLKNTCRDDASYSPVGGAGGEQGVDFIVYEPTACLNCGYIPKTAALLTRTLDADLDCAVPSCDSFKLQTTCICPLTGGDPPWDTLFVTPGNPGCLALREHHESYRLNYDLPDNDDDRHADPGGVLDLAKVRRDRFLPGDTLRSVFSTKVVCADSIRYLFYQVFTEIVGSDFGYAGVFDTFNIGPLQSDAARTYFTNNDFLKIAEAQMTVWDSSANAVYTFPLSTFFPIDQLYGRVAVTNTKPPAIIDHLASMNYPFYPYMDSLADAGYVPPGFRLATGDSVELRVDLKLGMNYAPDCKQNFPPLINFEMGYNQNRTYRFYNYRQRDTLMFQYSGYVDSLNSATFGIRPCQNSVQVTPFAYNIRIARENMFPFEVRPLSVVSNYDLIIPPGVTPKSAELVFLTLQKNIPFLQNVPLPFSFIPDSMLHVDFTPAYLDPPDEGYGLRTLVEFEPSCDFTKPDSSAQWVTLDFPGCMSLIDPITYVLENKIGFYSNHPSDTIVTNELVVEYASDSVAVAVLLQNLAPVAAPNYWVQLLNPEGGLSDLTIKVLGSGTVISPVNGLYQLGSLPILGAQTLLINGINRTCDPQRLLLIYGWNCAPLQQAGAESCARDTLELLFRPQNPEIELELIDFPVNIPLCDSSDYFLLELSNADLGYAYKPYVNIELPAGLQLLPGSCQMAYPAGSTFVPIPDPVNTGNKLLEWDLALLQSFVGANGLPGVDLDPENALQIRFKVVAGCGAVSNAQLVFGARASWSCGRPTNTLRKASDPILVEGLQPAYDMQVSVSASGIGSQSPCAAERTMTVSLSASAPAQAGDSIYISLPAGYGYVSGSYQPGANAPSGPPQLTGQELRLPVPAGLPANTVINFTFTIQTPEAPDCDGSVLRVQARQQTAAFCPVINADCQVFAVTGEATYAFPPSTAQAEITNVQLAIGPDGSASYVVSVKNGNDTQLQLVNTVQFFYDIDHDGLYSPADVLVYTADGLNALISPGGLFDIPITGLPAPDSLCNLLAVLPALENCLCPLNAFPILSNAVTHTAVELCPGDSVSLGVPQTDGHFYQWSSGISLPCTDCSGFVFPTSSPGLYQFTLTDQGAACMVTHSYTVHVNDVPVLASGDTSLCRGGTVLLQTSPALSWQWQGPGVTQPNAPVQTLQPEQSAVWYVTATNAAGCVLSDSLAVTVLPADTIDLGTLLTCEGTPVDIFGTLTETPGLYTQSLTNANGCDSLVYLNLEIVPHTAETITRCAPDTVLVFGEPVTEAGMYCETFESSLGCDSIHCITITDFPVPDLPDPDTFYIVQGGSVTLPGPDGYVSYLWTPADYLSCTDCQSPVASPPDTMEYTLLLLTGDGCTDTLIYRVVVFPPCDPARIRVPNAFTPDGDGVNDVFQAVPIEGSEVISRLTIYNRWGQKVYETTGPNASWDGTTFGEPAPSDVYVWLLEVLCDGEDKKFRKGDVTVMR